MANTGKKREEKGKKNEFLSFFFKRKKREKKEKRTKKKKGKKIIYLFIQVVLLIVNEEKKSTSKDTCLIFHLLTCFTFKGSHSPRTFAHLVQCIDFPSALRNATAAPMHAAQPEAACQKMTLGETTGVTGAT